MLEVEPYLIELCIKLAGMRVPITTGQGLEFSNSLLDHTSILDVVNIWRTKHCAAFHMNENAKLGIGYWRGCKSCWKHELEPTRGVKYDKNRADCCTYQKFDEMYNEMYKKLVNYGIDEKPLNLYGEMKKMK